MKKPLGIYVHIPFCVRKCLYCDFLSFSADEETKESYVKALLEEIEAAPVKFCFDPSEYEVRTIYIGGGTPSCVDEVYINKILCKLNETFHYNISANHRKTEAGNMTVSHNRIETLRNTGACEDEDKYIYTGKYNEPEDIEITIEVNPNTADFGKLLSYKEAGINRLSIGLQSADNAELKLLGRLHTWEEFLSCYEAAQKAGFSNINVDIMTALPGQKAETLRRTLCKLAELSPAHISAYSLILEEGTPFYEMYGGREDERIKTETEDIGADRRTDPWDRDAIPSEEEERALYYLVRDELGRQGYKRYEISNFAREGYESRHNTSYWKRIPYLGLGLGASGLINEVRYKNTTDMAAYLGCPASRDLFEEEIALSENDRMEETMFLGLRMSEGVRKDMFFDCYKRSIEEVYGKVLQKLEKDGLILNTKERVALTDKGIDYGNYVFSRFTGFAG